MELDNKAFKIMLLETLKQLKRKRCNIEMKQVVNQHIHSFLHMQSSVEKVVEEYPEIGHVLSILQEDDEFLMHPDAGTHYVTNLLWFYRPSSLSIIERRTSHWAQSVFRCTFRTCIHLNCLSFLNFKCADESAFPNPRTILTLFENSLDYFSDCNIILETVCYCGTILLRHDKISNEHLKSLIKLIPDKVSDNIAVRNLLKAIAENTTENKKEDDINRSLAMKSHSYFEAMFLEEISYWLSTTSGLPKRSWFIQLLTESSKHFQVAIQMLHTVYVQCNYASKIEKFIHHFITVVRNALKSISNLYPNRMVPIVCLLEEKPSAELAEQIYTIVCNAIFSRVINSEEAFILSLHFSEWSEVMENVLTSDISTKFMLRSYLEL